MTRRMSPSEIFKPFLEADTAHCFIMAEVAQTHEGSLGQAFAFIDAVAASGADAIKFQTHIADAESTPAEPFRVKFSRQDATRYDYWKRMEFTPAQWQALAGYATSKGLVFLSSPFSQEAVELLDPLVPAWKVGSGEVNNLPLLETMAKTGKPVLLSSGMSTWAELATSVALLESYHVPIVLFQTTTQYPTPPEYLGLNVLQEMRQLFQCPVGLSDHSGHIAAGLAAYTLGARFLEVHVTLSPWMFGPDVSSSLTVEGLKELVSGVRFLENAMRHPVSKDAMAQQLGELRQMFCKSVVPRRDLPAGTLLQSGDLTVKKPGLGIPAEQLSLLYGKRLKRNLVRDEFFSLADIEELSPAEVRQGVLGVHG